jgi:CopG family nickel-responsive transcriptional regulator
MQEVKRFGVSMEASLLGKLDGYCKQHQYSNRSEAIRDLIRRALVQEEWKRDRETVGSLTIVYDHHLPHLSQKINSLQHDFSGKVIAAMHVHLDHHNCMEVIVMRGKASQIKSLSDSLIALRGVKFGSLTGSTMGRNL